jgi:hypothetical protein
MLMLLDRRQSAQQFVEDLRARMAANRPERIRDLFPEWFGEDPVTDEVDDAQVEWSVPPKDQREELDRWIAARSSGTVTGRELASLDGAGEWL